MWSLSLRFSQENPVYTHSLPIHATCSARGLDSITRIVFGEEYRP
jgi:hypothetical protein